MSTVVILLFFPLLLLLFLLLFVYYCLILINNYQTITKLPAPTVIEQIKFLFFNKDTEFLENVEKLFDKYGETFQITIVPFNRLIITAHLPLVNNLLYSEAHVKKPHFSNKCLALLGGYGLATIANADNFKRDRKTIDQLCNQAIINKFIRGSHLACTGLIKSLRENVGKPIDIQPVIKAFTLEVVIDSMKDSRSSVTINVDTYLQHHETFYKCILERMYSPIMHFDALHRFTKNYQNSSQSVEYLIDITEELMVSHDNLNTKDTSCLITSLMESYMPYHRHQDNITTMIDAAFNITSSTVAFALYALAKYPDAQQNAFEEIVGILGENSSVNITMNETKQMKYLENVIKETLRFYTKVNWNQRIIGEDITTDDGAILPKGSSVAIIASRIHMSDKYYDNPKMFNPDRWYPDYNNYNPTKIHENAFLGFSQGPRHCIGKHIAMKKMKVMLAYVIHNFQLSLLDPTEQIFLTTQPPTKSLNGLHIIFNERNC